MTETNRVALQSGLRTRENQKQDRNEKHGNLQFRVMLLNDRAGKSEVRKIDPV